MLVVALHLFMIYSISSMMYTEASITLFILPAPLSAAHKAPQCGQSGWVQLG